MQTILLYDGHEPQNPWSPFSSMISFLAAALILTPLAHAIPLSQAVSEALGQSPNLQRASSALEESKWKRTESLSGLLPTVTASANHLFDKKYAFLDVNLGGAALSIPQVIPSTTYNLDARLPLFDGWATVDRYRAAGDFVQSKNLDLNWERFQVEREVVLLYYKAMAAQQLETVARENVRTLEDHLKDVQLFKKAGVSTNYDVLRVEVQVSEARSALLDSADNVAVALERLTAAMKRPLTAKDLEGTLPVLSQTLAQRLKETSSEERQDIQSLRAKVGGFDKLESAAAVHLVPKLFLFGGYQRYNNRDDRIWSNSAFRDAYQVGVGLNWNIFDGLYSYAKSKESIEQKVQAESSLEAAELRSKVDLELWKRKFLYFCSVYGSRQEDVQKAKEAVRLARAGRRVGARTNSDLLDAEADFHRSMAGSVNAQIGAIEALLNLELATGRRIYNFY